MIDQYYQLGDDALTWQFDVLIGSVAGFEPENMQFRILNFNPPEITRGVHEIVYKGMHFEKPNYDDETSKEFTFDIRVDKDYKYYKKIVNWLEFIRTLDGSAENVDVPVDGGTPNFRTSVTVTAQDINQVSNATWTFTNCFPKSIGAPGFDNSSAEAVTVTVTMSYVKMEIV